MLIPDSHLRALVLDDDAVYRRIVTTSLQRIGVRDISAASDLTLAKYKLEHEKFDLVTIDVVLREGSGLELLAWLRQRRPGMITIIVTAGSNSEANREVDALLLGASALVLKPGGAGAQDRLDKSFQDVIEGILRDRAPPTATLTGTSTTATNPALTMECRSAPRDLIAIGASTGGPPVVMQILSGLPVNFTTPILITQHMPTLHIPHFARLLKDRTGRAVSVAEHGERILPGRIYVAPGALHLTVQRQGQQLVMQHDDGAEEHHCKPSVDPMFRSVAAACGDHCIGVVLTGMGADGALGAAALRAKGAPVIVQDKQSSVVWGMPGATVQKKAASVVAPAAEIAAWITRFDASCTAPVAATGGMR